MANERQREVGREIRAAYEKSNGYLPQGLFLALVNMDMQRGKPLAEAELAAVEYVRRDHPDFSPRYRTGRGVRLDPPIEQWANVARRVERFGWQLTYWQEDDGSFAWAVVDPSTYTVLQSGIASDWDDARLSAIENLYPPSDERRNE
jgi:hypothetical protein